MLLSAAVLAVMRRRPSAYIANREAFIVLPALLVPLLAIRLSEWQGQAVQAACCTAQGALSLHSMPGCLLRKPPLDGQACSWRLSKPPSPIPAFSMYPFAADLADVFGHLQRHGGSPLRLLGLLLLSHPGTWVLISALCGGAAIAANVLVLPMLAAPTVSS